MTTGKTIALTRQTFVDKVMSLLFNMLSRLVIAFLPRSKPSFNLMAAVTMCSDSGPFIDRELRKWIASFWGESDEGSIGRITSLLLTRKSQTDLVRLHCWERLRLPPGWKCGLGLLTWGLAQVTPFGACCFFITRLYKKNGAHRASRWMNQSSFMSLEDAAHQTPWGQKLLCWGPFWTLPYEPSRSFTVIYW